MRMLSAQQKAQILARLGLARPNLAPQGCTDEALERRWQLDIEDQFASYVAARTARSMREAEDARTLARLRQANEQSMHPAQPNGAQHGLHAC